MRTNYKNQQGRKSQHLNFLQAFLTIKKTLDTDKIYNHFQEASFDLEQSDDENNNYLTITQRMKEN